MHQGEITRNLRERRGWTQDELAARLNSIGRRTVRANISSIEKRATLDGGLIADLAKAFGVSPSVFFDVEPSMGKESREAEIDRAFDFVKRDPQFQFGAVGMDKASSETKLAIIRLYEIATGKKLVSDEVV